MTILPRHHPLVQKLLALLNEDPSVWTIRGLNDSYIWHPSGFHLDVSDHGDYRHIAVFGVDDTLFYVELQRKGWWVFSCVDPEDPILSRYNAIMKACEDRYVKRIVGSGSSTP